MMKKQKSKIREMLLTSILMAVVMLTVFACSNEDSTPSKVSYAVGDKYPKTGAAIGVVFWVDPNDNTKGKIVSLDVEMKAWSTESISTNATSTTDGAVNTTKIKNFSSYTDAKYPAVAWCIAKGKGWYLPSKYELSTLYSNKTAVNIGLESASGATISSVLCWSSTEGVGSEDAWYVGFVVGNDRTEYKTERLWVRAIYAF